MKVITPRSHRISISDAQRIAECVARRMSESEGCRLIGLNPHSWRQWKRRNKHTEDFEAVVESIRAQKIDTCFQQIEAAAKTDWRAADRTLAHLDWQRYNDRRSNMEINTTVQIFSEDARKAALAAVFAHEPKQISTRPILKISAPEKLLDTACSPAAGHGSRVPIEISSTRERVSSPTKPKLK
jgi:hypothetical protein